jgi:diguanylate cyclase (GGDEF)-like protein
MTNPALRSDEPDFAPLHQLSLIEKGYLAVVAIIALAALGGAALPSLGHAIPSALAAIKPQIALAALLSAAGLELTRTRQPKASAAIGVALAALVALLGCAVLCENAFHVSTGFDFFASGSFASPLSARMSSLTAASFAALGLDIVFIRARRGLASHAADLLVSIFCLLVMFMVTRYMTEGLGPLPASGQTSLLVLLSLALLAFVAFMRRAEAGFFATLLGAGSGSRIARIAAPIALLVPFLPQTAFVRAVKAGLIRSEYLDTFAAFFVAAVSVTLILYMAWKINRLEKRIRELSLNDELTGLYNRRGFHLVAWQALRHARRSGLPFSILFITVLNQQQDKQAGEEHPSPELLTEVANLLKASFRDTDVIGRIDPLLFAVAGHFHRQAVEVMRLRLREAVNYRNSDPGRTLRLAFDVGFAVAADPRNESLEDLLAQADLSDEDAAEDEPVEQPDTQDSV